MATPLLEPLLRLSNAREVPSKVDAINWPERRCSGQFSCQSPRQTNPAPSAAVVAKEAALRIVGALILSLAGAITSFLAILTILDADPHADPDGSRGSRVGAFAEPRLESALVRDLAVIRPYPATIAPSGEISSRAVAGTPTGRPQLSDGPLGGALSPTTTALAGRKGAFVPPIVRRTPPDLEAEAPARVEPTIEGLLAASEATPTETRPKPGAAPAPAPRQTARATPTFDAPSRSALGGPRSTPSALPPKAAAPARETTRSTAATAPVLPKRRPALPRGTPAPVGQTPGA